VYQLVHGEHEFLRWLKVRQPTPDCSMVVKPAPDRQWAGALGVRVEALSCQVGICGRSAGTLLRHE
jgi:hypothetical protein